MLQVFQHFSKYYSCHLQAECVWETSRSLIREHAVDSEWDVKDIIGRKEKWAAIQLEASMWFRMKVCEPM
jgi:hypothetical protein